MHVTIRALESRRQAAAATDPSVATGRAAFERAASIATPFGLAVTGVTMSRAGVMAQIEATGDGPWRLMRSLADELGDAAWFEAGSDRDIVSATLVHFAADVDDPAALVDWVERHRDIAPIRFTAREIERVRFTYVAATDEDPDRRMRPETWLTAQLTD